LIHFYKRTHNIIKTVQIIRPDNMMDDTQYNDENSSSHAFMLQAQLTKIKQDIVAAKAKRKAERMTHFSTNNTAVLDDDGDLYGPEAGKVSDELHRLTRERTQTYLNFTSLQAALKADQTNKAITRAFNLESDGDIALEKEEEQHVRELLEEQKELTVKVIKQHEEGVKQELELMKARLELAKLHSRYSEIIGQVVESRRSLGSECWEQETVKLHDQVKKGDHKINQMRFMIQKFMISFNKFGLQFEDEALNARYKTLLLRCGQSPEKMRQILIQEESSDMAPAAAGDLQN